MLLKMMIESGVHELVDLVDDEGNIWSSNGEALKSFDKLAIEFKIGIYCVEASVDAAIF